jgi:tetratricopeptide (TPR) repeat protein
MKRTPAQPEDAAIDPTAGGWRDLSLGHWQTARAAFESALKADETAEALEGLSWAAWWQDDATVAFRARETAYHLYRRTGNATGAARMATWLAIDHLDFHGARAVANGWVRRARRLLAPIEPGPDHGWLAFLEGYLAHAGGQAAKAQEFARRATGLGRQFGVPDLQMLGLALEGAALVACGQVTEGMCCLDEATVMAMDGEARIPIASAWACCFLVSACAAVRDYERAYEWCDRIAEFAKRYGSRYMLAFCRAEYAAVHLWRGRWGGAEALLNESIEEFRRSRPAMVGSPLLALAELRRRQGRDEEATRLLEQAGPSTNAQLIFGYLALDRGDAARAAELAERCLRQVPAERKLSRTPALELLAPRTDRARRIRASARGARGPAGDRGTRWNRALARWCGRVRGHARGRGRRARPRPAAAGRCRRWL